MFGARNRWKPWRWFLFLKADWLPVRVTTGCFISFDFLPCRRENSIPGHNGHSYSDFMYEVNRRPPVNEKHPDSIGCPARTTRLDRCFPRQDIGWRRCCIGSGGNVDVRYGRLPGSVFPQSVIQRCPPQLDFFIRSKLAEICWHLPFGFAVGFVELTRCGLVSRPIGHINEFGIVKPAVLFVDVERIYPKNAFESVIPFLYVGSIDSMFGRSWVPACVHTGKFQCWWNTFRRFSMWNMFVLLETTISPEYIGFVGNRFPPWYMDWDWCWPHLYYHTGVNVIQVFSWNHRTFPNQFL